MSTYAEIRQQAPLIKGAFVARPRAYRINDACATLQISRSHIYAMAAKGKVKFVKIGNRTVVPASEIDRLLGEVA